MVKTVWKITFLLLPHLDSILIKEKGVGCVSYLAGGEVHMVTLYWGPVSLMGMASGTNLRRSISVYRYAVYVCSGVWLCACCVLRVCVCVCMCECVAVRMVCGVCVCACAYVRENTFLKNMTKWPTCYWNGTFFFDVGPV